MPGPVKAYFVGVIEWTGSSRGLGLFPAQVLSSRPPAAERPPDPQFTGFRLLVRRKARKGPGPQIALSTTK
jgi:hypothetical protein